MDQDLTLAVDVRPAPRLVGLRRFGIELAQTLAIMAVLFFVVRGVVQNFRVEGPSMQPTLTTGEFLWVNKAAYFEWSGRYVLGGPQRGDIAVLHAPDGPGAIDLIKRVIGLPGDRLRIERGQVLVNGQRLVETYIRFHASYTFPEDGTELIVPAGQYFVLGDNRPNSRDSHMGWFVPAEDLVGRAWLSYWPPSAWGVV